MEGKPLYDKQFQSSDLCDFAIFPLALPTDCSTRDSSPITQAGLTHCMAIEILGKRKKVDIIQLPFPKGFNTIAHCAFLITAVVVSC